MALKALHEFDVVKKIKQEVTEETPEGKLVKTVEVEQPFTIILKKPRRDESEEAEFVHAQEYGRCFRAGLLTNAMVNKRLEQDDYVKTQQEKAVKFTIQLEAFRTEYQSIKTQAAKAPEDEARLKELEEEWMIVQTSLQSLQDELNGMFNDTAETKARNKTIQWLTLNLTYLRDEAGNERPFFRGEGVEGKLKYLDTLNDLDDPFNEEVINRANFYITLWYMGKVSSPEDFVEFDKSQKKLEEQAEADEKKALEEAKLKEVKEEPAKEESVEEVKEEKTEEPVE